MLLVTTDNIVNTLPRVNFSVFTIKEYQIFGQIVMLTLIITFIYMYYI